MQSEAQFWSTLGRGPLSPEDLAVRLVVDPEHQRLVIKVLLRSGGLTPNQASEIVVGGAPIDLEVSRLLALQRFVNTTPLRCNIKPPAWLADDALCLELAGRTDVPPRFLQLLALRNDEQVLRVLVRNPNLPIEPLGELACSYPGDFIENPLLSLLTLPGGNMSGRKTFFLSW